MNFRHLPGDSPEPLPKHLLDRIETGLLADLHPVKPLASSLRATIGLLTLSILVIAAFIARLGLAGWKALGVLQALILLGIIFSSLCLLAHLLSKQMSPGTNRPLSPKVVLVMPVIALALATAILFPAEMDPKFVSAGFRCWRAGVVCAAVAAPMFWRLLRRGFALAPIQHGATAGLLAGFTGVAVLTIECAIHNSLHMNTWHLGAGLVAMAFGTGLGFSALQRRRRMP